MFTSSDDIKSNMEIILRCNFEAHFLEEKRWWSKPIRQKLIFWGKHGGMVILNGTRSRGVQSSTARLWYKSCWKLWDYDSSLGDLWVLSGCEKQMQPMKTTSGETSPPSLEDLTKSYHQYHQYNIIYIYINMICISICSCNCTHIMDHFFPTTFYFSWWSIYLPKNQKNKNLQVSGRPQLGACSGRLSRTPATTWWGESAAESLSGGGRGGRERCLCASTPGTYRWRLVVIPRNQRYLMPGCRK